MNSQTGQSGNTELPLWKYDDYPDEMFFTELLNLDYPGLEGVKEAVGAQDWKAAKAALLDYYRQRKEPSLPPEYEVEPADEEALRVAELAVQHEFQAGNSRVKFDERVDWFFETDCVEDTRVLGAMSYLRDLAGAYRKTGDEKYARTMLDLLEQWIDNVPVVDPEPLNFVEWKATNWQVYDVAGRLLHSWPQALLVLRQSPSTTPAAFTKILKSLYKHVEYLLVHHATFSNHCTAEAAVIFISAVLWPEFRRSEEWWEHALWWLEHQAREDYYPDGFTREMATNYHGAFGALLIPYKFTEHNGLDSPFSEEYMAIIHRCFRVVMHMIKPDGCVPRFNDALGADMTATVLEGGELFDDPEMLYVGSGGERGQEPAQTSHFFPDARYAIMRSDWSPEADYLIMDCGPAGTNHVNPNQLAVEVCARGVRLIENSGYYRRLTSFPAEWFPMARWYGKDSRSYSTLNIVRSTQVGGDADGYLVSHPAFDYAAGWYKHGYMELDDGTHERAEKVFVDVVHTRRVFCLTKEYWLILDSLDGEGAYPVELHWQFRPGAAGLDEATRECWTEQEGVRLWLRPANPEGLSVRIAEGETNPHAGWYAPRYHVSEPAPEAIMQRTGELPITFATLLWAQHDDDSGPRIGSADLGEEAAGVLQIKHAEGTDYLQVVPEGKESDDIVGLRAEAELVWIRVDEQGQPQRALLAKPSRVWWQGEELWMTKEAVEALELSWADGVPQVCDASNED